MPAGVRSAQCAVFHAQPGGPEPATNDSTGRDKAWVEDPPERTLYKSQYSGTTQEEQGAGTYIFIALCCVFVAAVIGCIYEVWRSARKDRQRRRSAASGASAVASGSQRWQSQQFAEPLVTGSNVKTVGFKNVIDDDKRPNGTHVKVPSAKEYKPLPNTEPKDLNDKKVHIKADEEPEKKELLGVNTGIVTKAAKPNPFSMEDLQEEPELEEREEEEEEEEEEKQEEEKEEKAKEEKKDIEKPEVDENKEEEEKKESNEQDDELLLRPHKNWSSRTSVEESVIPLDSIIKPDETKISCDL